MEGVRLPLSWRYRPHFHNPPIKTTWIQNLPISSLTSPNFSSPSSDETVIGESEMDEMAVETATSLMALANLESHETTTPSNSIPISTLPIELFFKIFSHLVHDIRSWQHQLDYQNHDHLIDLTQRVKIGHLRALALTCKTMQQKVALFCSTHTYLVVTQSNAATQLVGILRRLAEQPKRAPSVKRLYLGLDPARNEMEGLHPHSLFLTQAADAVRGVVVPEIIRKAAHATKDKTSRARLGLHLGCQLCLPVAQDILLFLASLLISQLEEVQECTIAAGPEVLAALVEKPQHSNPFFPKMTSLTLMAAYSTKWSDTIHLEPSIISSFLALSSQLTGLRLDGFHMRLEEPVTGVENISSIILRGIIIDSPSLHLLLKGCNRLRTFMCFSRMKSDCGTYSYRQVPKAHNFVDALEHSADTLRTLCLGLNQSSVTIDKGKQVLFSVSNFTNLQRVWVDGKTVLINMHTPAQTASTESDAGNGTIITPASKGSHFLRTLPTSLNKLHLAGPADGLASEMPYLAKVGGLKQLAVEPAAVKDAIGILKEAGIEVLEEADQRPVLW